MQEIPASRPATVPELLARLQDVASLLRESAAVDPLTQRTLSELREELEKALQEGKLPPAEVTHLAETATHLAELLHHQQEAGVLERARDRLEQAAINAESHAPLAVGLVRRLLVALSNIGI